VIEQISDLFPGVRSMLVRFARQSKPLTVGTGITTLFFVWTAMTTGWGAAQAAEIASRWNDKTVVAYLQIAPLSRIERDLEFLSDGTGPAATTEIRDAIGELSAGVDSARPAGMAVLVDERFVPVIFVPIKEEDRIFTFLHSRFGWRFHRGDDGLFRGSNVKAVARASGKWLYFTGPDHREHLTALPDDPAKLFAESDPGILGLLNVAVNEIPTERRTAFAEFLGGLFGERDGDDMVSAIAGHALEHLVTDSQSWQVELQYVRPLEQFHVTAHITPVQGSDLERWISIAGRRPMLMEHLSATDSVTAAVVSAMIEGKGLELLKRSWGTIDADARAKLPSPQSGDASERRLAQLGTTTLDAVSAAVARGEFDVGLAVQKQGDETVFLTGSTLAGSRRIEESALSLFEMLNGVPAFQALQWATGANGDVTFHEFQIPADEKTRPWVGETVHLAAGFGPDRIYAAMGGASTMEKLSQAVDRSRDDAPSPGRVVHATVRMAPFLALLDKSPGSDEAANANVREFAEAISHYRRNDALEFNLTAANRGLEGNLRIDLGVVRMLASAVGKAGKPAVPDTTPASPPAAGGTNLALRLEPGARFQLQFDSESEVKTVIDEAERVDLGQYSSTYEFCVLEARPDGAVRLEAVLKRAKITKTGPDGDLSFDSATKESSEKMTAETVLYAAMIDEPFQMTVAADGTVAEFGGLAEAVDRMVDNKLQPPANERAQAKAFVERAFNPDALRDTLGRAFDFYPGKPALEGDRWARTIENYSGIAFVLDNKYQLKSLATDEAVISVRAQVGEKKADDEAPIRWEVLGTQTGVIRLDPRNGRLLKSEYVLKLEAEATLKMDGKTVVRPVTSTIKMTIGPPAAGRAVVAEESARKFWRHESGHFADHGSGDWTERSQNGAFELREVERTPQRIELVSKSGTGTRVRLFAGRSEILRRGQGTWELLYEGDWAAPQAAEKRVFWSHPLGFFDNVADGKWLERSPNGAFYFVEAARTDDYVELRNTRSGTLVRLFNDRCELKVAQQREFAVRYQGGWKGR
jgi:hypothetical protein